MNHLKPKSLVAAVAAAALLGASAPAAVAAPPADRPSHATKAERDAAKAERKADRDAAKETKADARVDRALARIAESRKLESLDEATRALVEANIAADALVDGADLRPSTYRQIINQLAFAERLVVAAGTDTVAVAAVDAAVAKLVAFSATTEKAALRATKAELQVVAALLDDETEETDETDETDETVTETPEVPESVIEEPTADEPGTVVDPVV